MISRLVVLTTILLSSAAASADACDRQVNADRIAVAGGSITEILFALEQQQRIVAVDRTSNFPAAALTLPQIGYVRNLSAEGVLSLKPTVVLGEHDMGPPEVAAQLERVGVPIVRVPEAFTLEGIKTKVRCVAALLDLQPAGEALIAQQLAPLAQVISAQQSSSKKPRGMVLLGLRQGAPVAAGSNTSGDGLLRMAGVNNVMTGFDGWKPVSVEAMATAAPEVIVIPESGLTEAGGLDQLLAHPALRLTPAAEGRRVVAMDGMAMLGFGLRTARAATELHAAVTDAADQQLALAPQP